MYGLLGKHTPQKDWSFPKEARCLPSMQHLLHKWRKLCNLYTSVKWIIKEFLYFPVVFRSYCSLYMHVRSMYLCIEMLKATEFMNVNNCYLLLFFCFFFGRGNLPKLCSYFTQLAIQAVCVYSAIHTVHQELPQAVCLHCRCSLMSQEPCLSPYSHAGMCLCSGFQNEVFCKVRWLQESHCENHPAATSNKILPVFSVVSMRFNSKGGEKSFVSCTGNSGVWFYVRISRYRLIVGSNKAV